MDLWVRNQDRDILTRVKKIYVTKTPNAEGYGIYEINPEDLDDCDIYLGVYKERERALEVLEEIQKTIINNEIIRLIIPNVSDIKGREEQYKKEIFNKMIYEMPKE